MMESDPKSKTRVKFSTEQDLRLLYEVEKRPILWDPTLDIYKRADIKPPVWAQVAQNIGPEFSGEDASARFKSLNDTFMRNWRKVQDSMRSGAGTDDMYRPKWSLYGSCQFLKKTCAQTKSTSNIPESSSALNQTLEIAESSILGKELEDSVQVYYDETLQQFMAIPTDDSMSESLSPAGSCLLFPSGPCSPDIMIPPRPTSAPAAPPSTAQGLKRSAEVDQPLFSKKGSSKKSGASLMEEAVKVMREIAQKKPPSVEPATAAVPNDRVNTFCAFIASRLRSLDEEKSKSCENALLAVLMEY